MKILLPFLIIIATSLLVTTTALAQSTFEPIRISFSTLDLDDDSQYCNAAGETRPNFKGGTRTCTEEDIFTSAKKDVLVNTLLPEAKKILSNAFSVVRLTSNLMVGSTSQCTGGFTIPSDHVSSGIANTDFIVYVSAGPTREGEIAFAATCQDDGGSPSRPVVALLNFGPRYLTTDTLPIKDAVQETVHQVIHSLGFSHNQFNSRGLTFTEEVRGTLRTLLNVSSVTTKLREYFGCDDISGIHLESEGGSGIALSHIDTRFLPTELMTDAGGRVLSFVTLGIMESLGVYKANYSAAESMLTGKNVGCDYLTSTTYCNEQHNDGFFCPAENSEDVGCTFDLQAYGVCTTPFLSDGCNYYNAYSNKKCYDTSQSDNDHGENFHDDSRCFNVSSSDFRKSTTSTTTTFAHNKRCFQVRCNAEGTTMEFAVSGFLNKTWHKCDAIGQPVYVEGYDNNLVICPNITEYCTSVFKYEVLAPKTAAAIYVAPTPAPPNDDFWSRQEVIIGFSCGGAALACIVTGFLVYYFYFRSAVTPTTATAAGDIPKDVNQI